MKALLPATVGVLLTLALTPAAQAHTYHCGHIGLASGTAANIRTVHVSCEIGHDVARHWGQHCVHHDSCHHVNGFACHGHYDVTCHQHAEGLERTVTFEYQPRRRGEPAG